MIKFDIECNDPGLVPTLIAGQGGMITKRDGNRYSVAVADEAAATRLRESLAVHDGSAKTRKTAAK